MRTPAPAAAAEQPAKAAASSKPLTPLAALWPSSMAARGEAPRSQGLAPEEAQVTANAPKPAPAAAARLPQPAAPSASPKSAEKAAVAAPAGKASAPRTLSVRFAVHKPDAKRVSVCGDFNGWSPSAMSLKRHEDGHWETTVALEPGRYEYKFIVDEEWITDPAAQKSVPNEHGSLNSVLEVPA